MSSRPSPDPAREHRDHDAPRAGLAQGPRRFAGRGARGQHVIDEEDGPAGQSRPTAFVSRPDTATMLFVLKREKK